MYYINLLYSESTTNLRSRCLRVSIGSAGGCGGGDGRIGRSAGASGARLVEPRLLAGPDGRERSDVRLALPTRLHLRLLHLQQQHRERRLQVNSEATRARGTVTTARSSTSLARSLSFACSGSSTFERLYAQVAVVLVQIVVRY